MIAFQLNGQDAQCPEEAAEEPLLWAIRDRFGLTGTKFGCGHGECGACMVKVDGDAIPSCRIAVKEARGRCISTIEALAARPDEAVIRAWITDQVPQCGYCQPGMIVAASALLAKHARPTDAEIDAALAHVLCRCGTYQRVRAAIHRAAEGNWTGAPFPDAGDEMRPAPTAPDYSFNPWVRISEDGVVTVVLGRSEMGQGVTTSLSMLVAEELEIPLSSVRTEFAPADPVYDNPIIGLQITVGSTSVQTSWLPLRRAGAEVRERLKMAAARRWNVDVAECNAVEGTVAHEPTGRRVGYGPLAREAAMLRPPENPQLKSPDEFKLLGHPTERLDIPDHVAGRTKFGLDVAVAGMRAATILMPLVLGTRALRIDSKGARAIRGVRDVLETASGIAVVAEDHWSALRGREALSVEWSSASASHLSSADIFAQFRQAAEREGEVLHQVGSAVKPAASMPTISADYATPYLAHAPIEPMNCTARVTTDRCDVWVPTQGQGMAREAAARASGLALDHVFIHSTFIGGGFGRRSVPDVVTQAVEIAKRTGEPIQLFWTRADDLRHDRYRPASFTRICAGLDTSGRPAWWRQCIVGPPLAGEGVNFPYDVSNVRIEHVLEDPGVPTGYWRSVGASQNAFVIEGFVDELAAASGQDPVAYRLAMLPADGRHRAVLELAAEKAGWGTPLIRGRGRGVAVYYAHGSWVAEVAEITIVGGAVRVDRVVCAVDCGFVVNPDTVIAQIEGGVAFGLTGVLKSAVTVVEGHPAESGFHDYPLLTIGEMPRVEVHIVKSAADPTGVGEGAVPTVPPAVCNAIFAATGQRIRALPVRGLDLL